MKMRINKFLSNAGVCSRRKADDYILSGRVMINSEIAKLGDVVNEGDRVLVDSEEISLPKEQIVLAFNKPIGVVCTASKKDKDNIVDYIGYSSRIYPVGRLDKDSRGLILLTNDGDITDRILRAHNNHEKEYVVKVNKKVSDEIVKALSQGVPILDTMTKPCKIKRIDDRTFDIILTQGLNRQIRRMFEYFDIRVVSLKRIRVMNIELGDLKEGTYRMLTDEELEVLNKALEGERFYNKDGVNDDE